MKKFLKKIDLLYNCNLREEIKLDTKINKPYNNFNNNIQNLTEIISKRFPNINETLLKTIQDPNTNIILLERIINSDFWKNNSEGTNQIWIAANSVFEDENIKKCEYCDQIDFGKYHALLIGIDVYEYNQNLDTPVNDVRTLEGILKNKYKFETLTILEGKQSRSEILDKLYNFKNTLTENDNLLVYFGGHGWRDPKTNRGYWLASESDNNKPYTMISSDDVSDVIKGLNAKQVLVISDSCYSAFMKDRSVDDSYKNFSLEGLQSRSQNKARRLISSGKDMPVPDSINNSENSLFASILFDELLSAENVLFAYDLWSKIDKRLSYSKFEQEPVYGDIGNLNIEFNGDFIFVPN